MIPKADIPDLVEWLMNRAIPIDLSGGRSISDMTRHEALTAALKAFNERESNDTES